MLIVTGIKNNFDTPTIVVADKVETVFISHGEIFAGMDSGKDVLLYDYPCTNLDLVYWELFNFLKNGSQNDVFNILLVALKIEKGFYEYSKEIVIKQFEEMGIDVDEGLKDWDEKFKKHQIEQGIPEDKIKQLWDTDGIDGLIRKVEGLCYDNQITKRRDY